MGNSDFSKKILSEISVEIERTADGSATLYRADLDEHYHSVKGALTESLHVYIRSGLERRAEMSVDLSPIRVLEVGFGTGLNAALAFDWSGRSGRSVDYTSLELYPLSPSAVEAMGYDLPGLAEVNGAEWNARVSLSPTFTIEKRVADFLSDPLPGEIDVVFFDAFAPEKQPEMWSEEAIRRVVDAMRPGGVFVTYCAKGAIRRMLASLGLTPERIPGPPGGKREILRATK